MTQILRLSLVYALLDRSTGIEAGHLESAVAVWAYAERSARFIFGDSTGNRHADALRRLLRRERTMTREDVRKELGIRHASELDEICDLLVALGYATVGRGGPGPQGGRPAVMVRATETT